MIFLRLLPVIISFLLLGAHFLRVGWLALALVMVFLPFLLLVKQKWAARLIQVLLSLGAVEWLLTMTGLIIQRQTTGEDYARMSAILVAVALFTVGSALAFRSTSLRQRYRLGKQDLVPTGAEDLAL